MYFFGHGIMYLVQTSGGPHQFWILDLPKEGGPKIPCPFHWNSLWIPCPKKYSHYCHECVRGCWNLLTLCLFCYQPNTGLLTEIFYESVRNVCEIVFLILMSLLQECAENAQWHEGCWIQHGAEFISYFYWCWYFPDTVQTLTLCTCLNLNFAQNKILWIATMFIW